jgi:hypothetical protein
MKLTDDTYNQLGPEATIETQESFIAEDFAGTVYTIFVE